jgi:hypothetical protein
MEVTAVTSDDKTETPIPRGQFAGGILMAVGTLAIVGTLGSSFTRPASTTVHGAILYLGMLIVIIGLVVCAASWVVSKQAERDMRIAEKVDAVDEVVRQLMAAPTVRLHEARQLMGDTVERVVGVAKAEVVREIGGKVEELQERFMDLEADLASFRLWQKRTAADPPARLNGNGKAVALRSVPSQPD